jgi:CHAT domain-containing protein/tetratricopeptide (TPR) repeat protein
VNADQKHLTVEQIDTFLEAQRDIAYGATANLPGEVRNHLIWCKACQQLLATHAKYDRILQTGLKLEQRIQTKEDCPSAETLRTLAAQLLPSNEAHRILGHVVDCQSCAYAFRKTVEELGDEDTVEEEAFLGALQSRKPEWQKDLATRLAATAKASIRNTPEPVSITFKSWLSSAKLRFVYASAAAAVLVIAFGVWSYRKLHESSVDQLLAQAYAEQRTLELRIAGAEHAPLRQERGAERSSLAKPAALLKAEYEIRAKLEANPEDSTVFASKGRAELLEWQYDQALQSLKRALSSNPNSAEVMIDLASAYAERAEAEDRTTDLGQALEYLGEALAKHPEHPVALYNRAVVDERLFLYEEAQNDWLHYLRVEPRGAWAKEAKQRLEAVQLKLPKSSSWLVPETDAEKAAVTLQLSINRSPTETTVWPDSLDEEYLDIALQRWLPAAAERQRSKTWPEWKALQSLADVLLVRHQDIWLADLLSVKFSARVAKGWKALGAAARLNSEGDFDGAHREAEEAAKTLSDEHCLPGVVLARWEEAYALQRAQEGRLCLDAIRLADSTYARSHYPWVASQLALEKSICSAMVGQMGRVRDFSEEATKRARSSHYSTLGLRCMHIAGTEVAGGNTESSWTFFKKGLASHWAGSYRPFRVYQFYAEMSVEPESVGQWYLARSLMSEAVIHISRTPNRLMEAMARQSLAVDVELSGDKQQAIREFQRADELFSSLPETSATRALQFSAKVAQISLEAEQTRNDHVLRDLEHARQFASSQSQYWDWLNYYQTLGDGLWRHGDVSGARKALRATLYIGDTALGTVKDDADRLSWERRMTKSYSSLVELELSGGYDPISALEYLEWYRSAALRAPPNRTPPGGIDFASLEANPPLPRMSFVSELLPRLKRQTVVAFAKLKDGTAGWLFDDRGLHSFWVKSGPDDLSELERRFLNQCSNPSSNLDDLRLTGKKLHDRLFGPVEEYLDPSRVLYIEADGVLQQIPFEALVTPTGDFLAQHFTVIMSPGLAFWPYLRTPAPFPSDDKVLVVGNSLAGTYLGTRFVPLQDSETEARDVAQQFKHSELLLGTNATSDAIKREIPGVLVFHFAGHAITSPARTGLIVARAPASDLDGDSNELLDSSAISGLNANKLKLVVLSACSTAGEESGLADPRSLVRAFLKVGVPDVIASRWRVDSRTTSVLMGDFYNALNSRRSPSEALRIASAGLRKRSSNAHPYYWSAFTVFGRE